MDYFDKYAAWVPTRWTSRGREKDLFIMSTGLGGETGEVLELLKKSVRDGNLDLNKLKKELGDVLFYWTMIAHHHGINPSDILAANVEKVDSRHVRGVVHGSGDDR